jgi:hypothetical protein
MLRALLWAAVALGQVTGPLCLTSPAAADPGSCIQVGLDGVNAECSWTYADYSASSSSGDGHTWVVTIQCGNGGICVEHVECVENGEEGYIHDVFMDGTDVGDVCVPDNAVQEVDIRQLAIREFKRLDWPSSELTVQPPGGETLVNLETIFYTTNSAPTSRTVTLAGRSVTIEATPTSYAWHFGDGTIETTTSPGHPHPDHDVFHVYASTGEVAASVSTTYAGRFRIGNGDWQQIPDTLTVDGAPVGLTILEARPQLVLR